MAQTIKENTMAQTIWENKVIVCDICRKNEMKQIININNEWLGVCNECKTKKESEKCTS